MLMREEEGLKEESAGFLNTMMMMYVLSADDK